MNRKIFLAGASGVIGRRLGPLLVEADYEVFGTTAVKLSDSQIAALDQITAPAEPLSELVQHQYG